MAPMAPTVQNTPLPSLKTARMRKSFMPKMQISLSMEHPPSPTSVNALNPAPLAIENGIRPFSGENGTKPGEFVSQDWDFCPERSRARSSSGAASALDSQKTTENRRIWSSTAPAEVATKRICARRKSTRTESRTIKTTWSDSSFSEWTKLDSYSVRLDTSKWRDGIRELWQMTSLKFRSNSRPSTTITRFTVRSNLCANKNACKISLLNIL